jgi:2-methylcitrate dehydratase PrpD
VHTNHQQIVDTLVRFKAEHHSFRPEDLRRVTVRGPESTMERRHAVLEPTTVMGSKYSTPFTTAVALFRDLSDPLNYDETAVRDSRIRDVAKQVVLVTTDDAGDRASGGDCEITLEMVDGKRHVLPTRAEKGSPRNPFTFEDGIAKFRQWTRRIISEDQSSELIESVRGLTEVKDMATRTTADRSSCSPRASATSSAPRRDARVGMEGAARLGQGSTHPLTCHGSRLPKRSRAEQTLRSRSVTRALTATARPRATGL